MEFTIYDDDEVAPFLEGLEERPQRKVLQRGAQINQVQFDSWFNLREQKLELFLLLLCCTA